MVDTAKESEGAGEVSDGLYIHPQDTTVLEIREGEETRRFVAAQKFMEVQKERDDYRRALALINAWRSMPGRNEKVLHRLLAQAGFDLLQAKAMVGLVGEISENLHERGERSIFDD